MHQTQDCTPITTRQLESLIRLTEVFDCYLTLYAFGKPSNSEYCFQTLIPEIWIVTQIFTRFPVIVFSDFSKSEIVPLLSFWIINIFTWPQIPKMCNVSQLCIPYSYFCYPQNKKIYSPIKEVFWLPWSAPIHYKFIVWTYYLCCPRITLWYMIL